MQKLKRTHGSNMGRGGGVEGLAFPLFDLLAKILFIVFFTLKKKLTCKLNRIKNNYV